MSGNDKELEGQNNHPEREFEEGDIILIRTARTERKGKLEQKWEGPFIVKKKTSSNSYNMISQTGRAQTLLDHREIKKIL